MFFGEGSLRFLKNLYPDAVFLFRSALGQLLIGGRAAEFIRLALGRPVFADRICPAPSSDTSVPDTMAAVGFNIFPVAPDIVLDEVFTGIAPVFTSWHGTHIITSKTF